MLGHLAMGAMGLGQPWLSENVFGMICSPEPLD